MEETKVTDKRFDGLQWKHKLKYTGALLGVLEERGLVKLTRKQLGKRTILDTFQFTKL